MIAAGGAQHASDDIVRLFLLSAIPQLKAVPGKRNCPSFHASLRHFGGCLSSSITFATGERGANASNGQFNKKV
jgi:hypothetical protein